MAGLILLTHFLGASEEVSWNSLHSNQKTDVIVIRAVIVMRVFMFASHDPFLCNLMLLTFVIQYSESYSIVLYNNF